MTWRIVINTLDGDGAPVPGQKQVRDCSGESVVAGSAAASHILVTDTADQVFSLTPVEGDGALGITLERHSDDIDIQLNDEAVTDTRTRVRNGRVMQ